jgi:hypothetical protein
MTKYWAALVSDMKPAGRHKQHSLRLRRGSPGRALTLRDRPLIVAAEEMPLHQGDNDEKSCPCGLQPPVNHQLRRARRRLHRRAAFFCCGGARARHAGCRSRFRQSPAGAVHLASRARAQGTGRHHRLDPEAARTPISSPRVRRPSRTRASRSAPTCSYGRAVMPRARRGKAWASMPIRPSPRRRTPTCCSASTARPM